MGLMAEMNASFQKLAHGKFWQRHRRLLQFVRRNAVGGTRPSLSASSRLKATKDGAACEMARPIRAPATFFNRQAEGGSQGRRGLGTSEGVWMRM
ncbi:MAG: hypothetical protein Kow00133_06430 [Amphiplicatus sp.]